VGVQPSGSADGLLPTDEGYADQLHTLAQARWPGLRLVKLGCPAESTQTLICGGLCDYPRGNQLAEAEEFLRRHRRSIAFVTIDIGFNDFSIQELAAVPSAMAVAGRNLALILDRLRAAAGPSTPIVGMSLYDPYLSYWLNGPEGQGLARLSVAAIRPINELVIGAYHAAGCEVADITAAFATEDFETQVPLEGHGQVPLNVARIVEWTWAAAEPPWGPDFHANVKGYEAMADAFAAVLLPQ
jgi:lysophospholipase L1-like esterase